VEDGGIKEACGEPPRAGFHRSSSRSPRSGYKQFSPAATNSTGLFFCHHCPGMEVVRGTVGRPNTARRLQTEERKLHRL